MTHKASLVPRWARSSEPHILCMNAIELATSIKSPIDTPDLSNSISSTHQLPSLIIGYLALYSYQVRMGADIVRMEVCARFALRAGEQNPS